jgi:hypothetical protein
MSPLLKCFKKSFSFFSFVNPEREVGGRTPSLQSSLAPGFSLKNATRPVPASHLWSPALLDTLLGEERVSNWQKAWCVGMGGISRVGERQIGAGVAGGVPVLTTHQQMSPPTLKLGLLRL